MSRESFFKSDVPGVSSAKEIPMTPNISTESEETQKKVVSRGRPARNRIAYTVKVDPNVKQTLRKFAFDNDTTASAVIETLVRKYVQTGEVTISDIQSYSNYEK